MFKIAEKENYWSEPRIYTVCAIERVNSSLTLFLIFRDNRWEWVDSDLYKLYEG